MTPRVNTNPPANAGTPDNEQIVEYSNGPTGGLISFRAEGDKLVVELYRHDPDVDIRVSRTEPEVPVRRMLDLSTAHLPADVGEDLGTYEGVIADRRDNGWLVWVPDEVDHWFNSYERPSPSLLTVLRFARANGCDYVLFDNEGPTQPNLPVYDW